LTSEPTATPGRNVLGPGRVTDVSFSGVSTQYQVALPGLGTVVVFAQNMVFGPVVNLGAEVWVAWSTDHGFGLSDDPALTGSRFPADTSTRSIATQTRDDLLAELEAS
ncbi:MAG: transporter ATP-binding protein, partial [Glaciihabitans sp.]|nr:transporter ATP-binding protein [Glaciihabitans sp.]